MKEPKQLLESSFVMDTHLDLMMHLGIQHAKGERHVIRDVYLDSFKAGHVDAVNAAIYVDSGLTEEESLRSAMNQVSAFYRELATDGDCFGLATCADDLLRLKSQSKLAVMMSLEGVEPLAGNPDMLHTFYELGVRIMALTWSRENWAADGSKLFEQDYVGGGITPKGWELLELARSLNVLIDISHLNDRGFSEIAAWETRPIIATHSDTRALSPTQRNLTDEQILEIGRLGGVIGANGISMLVDYASPNNATMEGLAGHMAHIKSLTGADKLCIGLDQCQRLTDNIPGMERYYDVIPSHDRLEKFVGVLQRFGFMDSEIEGALGGNVLRLIRATIG